MHVATAATSMPRLLDPAWFASTLLWDCLWWCKERSVSEEEYKEIMGFPRDYKFHEKDKTKWLALLSRGVCPPVAKWVFETVLQNFNQRYIPPDEECLVIKPGETADFLVTKKYVMEALRENSRA